MSNIIMSGIQPTGNLHLGNYIGALRNFKNYVAADECYFCVADLHAITVNHSPDEMAINVRTVAAAIMATVDHLPTDNSPTIFVQSCVTPHSEMAWLLNCVARMGWLERMPQFKDKAGENTERASIGLLTYPVLQAADILLYNADKVPVGIDQIHHLDLTGDIVRRFNHEYGEILKKPEAIILPKSKVMSLVNGSKKMSKSDPNQNACIFVTDDETTIARKIKKATASTEPLPETPDYVNPSVENLVNIYALLSNQTHQEVLNEFGGKGFGTFKPALIQLVVDTLVPFADRMKDILSDPITIDARLLEGNRTAYKTASATLKTVKQVMGFWSH